MVKCKKHKTEESISANLVTLENYLSMNKALHKFFSKKEAKCSKCEGTATRTLTMVTGPDILAMSLNGGGFKLEIWKGEYRLMGVVCRNKEAFHYSIVKRGK